MGVGNLLNHRTVYLARQGLITIVAMFTLLKSLHMVV